MAHINEHRRRPGLQAACFAVCYVVFLYFYISGKWLYISVPGLTPQFADLLFILAGSDCSALGIDVLTENPCDPWGRAHNYGVLWLEVGRLGITRDDITWLALTMNAIFIATAILIISPVSPVQSMITILFVLSPAVMLGLERANADLLVFSLLGLSLYLIHSGNTFMACFSCLIILFAAVLKLYPVVIVPVLIFYYSANRRIFTVLMATLLLFMLYLYLDWQNVSHLLGVIPNITWHYSMGGELLFSRLGYDLNDITRAATYFIALLAIVSGIAWGCRTKPVSYANRMRNTGNDWPAMLYLTAAVLVVFSFVIKNSFDYRNIYFLFLLPYLFRVLSMADADPQRKMAASAIVAVYLFLFWAEFIVSLLNAIPNAGTYIRILESILNWIMIVPVVMLAMQIAVSQSGHSWLMKFAVNPIEKCFTKRSTGIRP